MTKIHHTTSTDKGGVGLGVEQPLVRSVSSSSAGKLQHNPTRVNYSQSKGATSTTGNMTSTGTKPTLLELGKMRFLIMDAPRQSNLHVYIKEMRKHSVTDIVRVCEPTYQDAALQTAGISLHDMEYADGHSPPSEVIDQWLQLVDKIFFSSTAEPSSGKVCIAVHCVAGLGRAPVMVALAFVEFANMDPVDAVTLIRRHRRGAINEKQLSYLGEYRRHYRKQSTETGCACIIS